MAETIFGALGGKSFTRLGGGKVTVGELLRDDPPRYCHDFKREIYELAAGKFAARQGEVAITFSRQAAADLNGLAVRPEAAKQPEIVSVPYFFRYDDPPSGEEKCWYLNFADPHLFYAYDSCLFAQDEIQTLEHPLLASVMLRAERSGDPGLLPRTVEGGRPTPWIIANVPRWINVNTTVVDEDGGKHSIYGQAFDRADRALLRRAITLNDDPSARSNILAMAAPSPGYGEYKRHEIAQLLGTAIAGFAAAVEVGAGKTTVIHTGRWGAGAFGGSEELALCAQIVGGMLCGVSKLVFHAVSSACLENARKTAETVVSGSTRAAEIVGKLLARDYRWGCGDGN